MCTCFQRSAYTARSATQRAALHSAQRYSTQRYTAPSASERAAFYSIQCSVLAAVSPSQEKPSAAASGGTAKRSTKHCQRSNDYRADMSEVHTICHVSCWRQQEAERSGKREYCAAFNEVLPMQQRLETLQKVCALASAFSIAHIQRAALHSAQRYTAPSATLRPALHSAQRFTARSTVQCPALHCIASTVLRSVLAAVSLSQEKPSAAASGGTAQRSTKHCQCSNDSKRPRRCTRLHLLSAQRIYSAQRHTARSATLRPAFHSAQRYTSPSATLRPALHRA